MCRPFRPFRFFSMRTGVFDRLRPPSTPAEDMPALRAYIHSKVCNNPLRSEFLYSMDVAGRRTQMTEKFWLDDDNNPATPGVIDEAIAYLFDSNDQLTSENKFTGLSDPLPSNWHTGTANQATSYTWVGTQQASKTVSVNQSRLRQHFGWHSQHCGRLE